MFPATATSTSAGGTLLRRKTSRAALIPRSVGDTSPRAVLYSTKGVRTPSSRKTSS